MATDDFSKFAGILSATLEQHHVLGFEIAGISSPPLALVQMDVSELVFLSFLTVGYCSNLVILV